MAPSKKEKTKADLEDAIFRFIDKQEELDEHFHDDPDSTARVKRFNVGVVKEVLGELLEKWDHVSVCHMAFVKCREVDDEEDGEELQTYRGKYKENRRRFNTARARVGDAIDIQEIADNHRETEVDPDKSKAQSRCHQGRSRHVSQVYRKHQRQS